MARDIQGILERHGIPHVFSMVDSVLVRPGMYTMNGTIPEVAAFLEGYYSGVAKSRIGDSAPWTRFIEALRPEVGENNWKDIFREVAARYQTAEEAFDFLLDHFYRTQGDSTVG